MIGALVALGYLLTVIAAISLYNGRKTGFATIHFGKARTHNNNETEILITVYRAQQKQAFKLALTSVAAGVLLGAALITRLAATRTLDASVLTSVVGAAGDIWLAAGAMRLYSDASKRWEDAVRAVPRPPEPTP